MRTVWAVARHTLLRALRQKTAPILILLVIFTGPGLSLFLEGDLQLAGLIKTVLTFNIAIVSVALMFLTLYLSTGVLHSDIAGKQIFLLDTKPIPRWQTLAGIWLGIVILLAWLLLLAGVGCYLAVLAFASAGRWTVWGWAREIFFWILATGLALGALALAYGWVRRRRPAARAGWWLAAGVLALALGAWGLASGVRGTPRRLDTRGQDAINVWRQLLIARRSHRPPIPDIAKAVADRRRQLEAQGADFSDWKQKELEGQLLADVAKNTWRIPYGASYSFSFTGMPRESPSATEFMVRYKFHQLRAGGQGGGFGMAGWELRGGSDAAMMGQRLGAFKSGRPEEFVADYALLAGTGRLDVTIHNLGEMDTGRPATFFIPLSDGLELLAPAGTFAGNLAKAYALLWIRLAMLTVFGLFANTFMGGPVSAFFLFAAICVGQFNTAVLKSILPEQVEGLPEAEVPRGMEILYSAARLTMGVIPNFDRTDPTEDLLAGREITWWHILRRLLFDLGVRGGLAAAAGCLLYARREVGLPTYV